MKQYLINVCLFLCGFRWLFSRRWPSSRYRGVPYDPARHVWYADGWAPLKYLLLVYWWDVGLCVLCLGGAVEPISTFAQRHRTGTVWDKLLDVIERFDPGHGATSGPALWGSVESPLWVRIVAPTMTVGVVLWLVAR